MIEVDGEILPIWWGVLATLGDLPIGGHEEFEDDYDPANWANRLRVMLCQDKRTCQFHWSVKRRGTIITVTKLNRWAGCGSQAGTGAEEK